jgi:hypothetical protein
MRNFPTFCLRKNRLENLRSKELIRIYRLCFSVLTDNILPRVYGTAHSLHDTTRGMRLRRYSSC